MTCLFPFLVWKMTELRCCWVHFVGLNASSEGPYAWFNKGQSKMPERIEWHLEMIGRWFRRFHRRSFNTSDPAKWNVWFAERSTCTIWWRIFPPIVVWKLGNLFIWVCFYIRTLITFTVRTAKTFLQQVVWSPKHLQWEDNLVTWSSFPSPIGRGPGGYWNQLVSWEWTVRHCWVDDFPCPWREWSMTWTCQGDC